MMKRFYLTVAVLAGAVLLSSCSLFNREEQMKSVEIIKEDVSAKYDLAMAELKDVTLTKTVSCMYSQLNEEKVGFSLSGRKVEQVYVTEGQDVKTGDLLAKLNVSDIENEIESREDLIAVDELTIAQQEELMDFYTARINKASTPLRDKEEYILAKQKCAEKIVSCRNDIAYAKQTIEEDLAIIEQSYIYAGMDGMVSAVRDNLENWVSVPNSMVVTIIDASQCAFQTTDPDSVPYLHVGDRVTVEVSSLAQYPAMVSVADEETGKIVFELDEPDFSIAVGTRANVTLMLGERNQVLALPRTTVYSTDEFDYVYVLSENGVREIVKVKTGLVGNTYVEILDGLEMYTSVILR